MSPNRQTVLTVLVPTLVGLFLAGSCGYNAHVQDVTVNDSGELPGLAVGLATLGSFVGSFAIGAAALVAVLASRTKGRRIGAALLLAAVILPVGVIGGAKLGESGLIPLGSPSGSEPSPPPAEPPQ